MRMNERMKNLSLVKKWCDKKFRFATFVDPPTMTDEGLVTHPNGWASSALDKLPKTIGIDGRNRAQIIGKNWHKDGGLIVVAECRLGDLIDVDYGTFENASCCALIEYNSKPGKYGIVFSEDCVCTSIGMHGPGTGCNVANKIYIPRSRKMNEHLIEEIRYNLDHYNNDLQRFDSRVKISDDIVKEMFPDVDFSMNLDLRRLYQEKSKPKIIKVIRNISKQIAMYA